MCFFGLVICCSIYNAMLFQMDSLPLIDAIIFSVNIYKYKNRNKLNRTNIRSPGSWLGQSNGLINILYKLQWRFHFYLQEAIYWTRGSKSISFSFLLLFKRYILLDSDKVMGDHAVLNSEGVCLLSRFSSPALFIKFPLYLDIPIL